MAKKIDKDLILHGNLLKAILTLAIPVVINSFLQTMYNLTDTYWLGKIGTDELAAINLVTPVQNMVINFGSGITVAASVLIAQFVGAKDSLGAKAMLNQIFACAMIFAFVCAGIITTVAGNIVGWLGAEMEVFQYAKTYISIVICDMPFLYCINLFSATSQAQGDTVRPMLLNFLGICINMILDPLFMIVLSWGTAGAAFATLFSKIPSAIIALIALHSKKRDVYLNLKKLHFDAENMKAILRVGLPTAIGGSTMQLGFLLMSKNVFVYGKQAMAAYGIGNKVNGLITLPSNGIGSAVATIVGQNVGANQLERAKKGTKISMYIAVSFLFVGGMILSRDFISTGIVRIFQKNDPEVVDMAADFLSIMAFWCFTNGVYNCMSGLFQGTGHTEINMIIDATRLWVLRFATLYICEHFLHMGVRSIWYSVVVSNGIAAVILYLIYLSGYWRKPTTRRK